jgi:hypothetical protein
LRGGRHIDGATAALEEIRSGTQRDLSNKVMIHQSVIKGAGESEESGAFMQLWEWMFTRRYVDS